MTTQKKTPETGRTGKTGETQRVTWREFLVELGMSTDEADALDEQQRLHGICSESTCLRPIAHWCAVCGAKLCGPHLAEHLADPGCGG